MIKLKIEILYSPLATWSFVLFVLSITLHILALSSLLVVPEIIVIFLVFPIIPTHFVLMLGLFGELLLAKRKPFEFGRSWKYFFAALQHLPATWRYFGFGFWFIYAPIAAITCSMQKNIVAFFGLGVAALALIHFMAFKFSLPRRDLIIDTVTKL